jgi:Methylamine utilisation protein MauE
VLRGYRFFPVPLLWPVAVAITSVELLLAGWLLWGRALRQAAQAATALHLFYAAWAVFMLLRDKPILNCGCFGSFIARPLSWTTVAENMVLADLCLALYALCRRDARVMAKHRYE